MSIVSSSHTPQGRGEEKGANYKWPHPVLPDFSSSRIGPRFISAQAALRQDPPLLPGAPRCREVRSEAARSRPPAGRGPGPPAVLPWPLPGAPRLPLAVSRGHRDRAPRYRQRPRTAHTSAVLRAQVQSRVVPPRGALLVPRQRRAAGRGTGRNRCRLHKRQTCRRTGGTRCLCRAVFRARSVPRHPPMRTRGLL